MNFYGISCPDISAATGEKVKNSESLTEAMNILCHTWSLTATGPEDLKTSCSGQRFRPTILQTQSFWNAAKTSNVFPMLNKSAFRSSLTCPYASFTAFSWLHRFTNSSISVRGRETSSYPINQNAIHQEKFNQPQELVLFSLYLFCQCSS